MIKDNALSGNAFKMLTLVYIILKYYLGRYCAPYYRHKNYYNI